MAQFFELSFQIFYYAQLAKSFDRWIWSEKIRRRLFRNNSGICDLILVVGAALLNASQQSRDMLQAQDPVPDVNDVADV